MRGLVVDGGALEEADPDRKRRQACENAPKYMERRTIVCYVLLAAAHPRSSAAGPRDPRDTVTTSLEEMNEQNEILHSRKVLANASQ